MKLKDPALLRQACYVDGEWIGSESGETCAVTNPATGADIGVVPQMTASEVARAIGFADVALTSWRSTLAKERSRLLRNWFDLIIENQEDLALILTSEQGKPLREAQAEVVSGAAFIEWFAEEARRTYGEVIPTPSHDRRIVAIRQPIGVCAAITPWNFPNTIITRKAGAALAAGCTMIVRPDDKTPFSALALAELASRAGIPRGVFNVVTGDPQEIGLAITNNPVVRKLSFTGSTRVGSTLMAQSSGTVKKLTLELGATLRLLFSTTPTSRARWKERSPPNSATPARPAWGRTASICKTVSTSSSHRDSWNASLNFTSVMARTHACR
jgi:succinate-semialdehyde dehydrogenase/glutarate-semialdehyde dehydrogenase